MPVLQRWPLSSLLKIRLSCRDRPDQLQLRNYMQIERGHRPVQPFKDKVPSRFKRCGVLDRRSHFAVDENMTVSRLRAKPSREIHDSADRAIVAPPLEPDRPERRVSMGDADVAAGLMSGG